MIHQECKKCQFYNRIKHTLAQLDQRVKFIKPSPGDIPKIMGIEIYPIISLNIVPHSHILR
jgi:hypothetical protein